jgi:DNA-binding XRE family transcriptional regulator
MMLVGRIAREGRLWPVEVESIGGFTQGRTRKEAIAMLVELVQLKLEIELKRPGVGVRVSELNDDGPDAFLVLVEADEPALLGALVLKHQRQVHGLTMQEVAAKLGTENHNAYAAYEQGRRDPSIGKFAELLAAVAPEMAVTVGPRKPARAAPPRARRKAAGRRVG